MDFNQIIIDSFNSILSTHCFDLTDQFNGNLKYKNNGLYILFTRNSREQSNTFWVGRDDGFPIEIGNVLLKEFFKTEIEIEHKSVEEFSSNVYEFLETEGLVLLQAKKEDYLALERFSLNKIEEFNSRLAEQQYLDAANEAWRNENYDDFLKNLNKVNEEYLSKSYKEKYKIAMKKISK